MLCERALDRGLVVRFTIGQTAAHHERRQLILVNRDAINREASSPQRLVAPTADRALRRSVAAPRQRSGSRRLRRSPFWAARRIKGGFEWFCPCRFATLVWLTYKR